MLNYTKKVEKISYVGFTGVYRKRGCKEGETQGLPIICFNLNNMVFLVLAHVISNDIIFKSKELDCIRIELTLLSS